MAKPYGGLRIDQRADVKIFANLPAQQRQVAQLVQDELSNLSLLSMWRLEKWPNLSCEIGKPLHGLTRTAVSDSLPCESGCLLR